MFFIENVSYAHIAVKQDCDSFTQGARDASVASTSMGSGVIRMALVWFLAGVLSSLAAIAALLPWLRRRPRFAALPSPPRAIAWAAAVVPPVIIAAALALQHAAAPRAGFADAARTLAAVSGAPAAAPAGGPAAAPARPAATGAGSMDSAVANLEARLARNGGSADDWELLAKSFEFLGRERDAAQARAHRLPAPADTAAAGAAIGAVVSGEVDLAPALRGRAAPGETIFIVAKSVDTPGAPVAVFRGSVDGWPMHFSLDDSRSMLPGRNLSNAGRVTIEARISKKGQPLPAPGDLQGSSGAIDPAAGHPLTILIDRVIT